MIDSSLLLSVTTFLYLGCTVLYLSGVIFRVQSLLRAGGITGLLALLIQTAGLLLRWRESYQLGIGHAGNRRTGPGGGRDGPEHDRLRPVGRYHLLLRDEDVG